ncbi:DUF1045 domain-containing protein [Teichococcus aestuarii]
MNPDPAIGNDPASTRLALYWAPELEDPLHAAASAWLGRDAETGATLPQAPLPGVEIGEITADARRYGFHATLKPPFRLGTTYAEARAAAMDLAARTRPFALPPLRVADLDGFLALREVTRCPELHAFADDCVRALEPHRAPATAAEIARRRPERLPERERGYGGVGLPACVRILALPSHPLPPPERGGDGGGAPGGRGGARRRGRPAALRAPALPVHPGRAGFALPDRRAIASAGLSRRLSTAWAAPPRLAQALGKATPRGARKPGREAFAAVAGGV